MTDSPFAEFQTDNLMLLMGTNPLPNYVAAKLLAKPGGDLFLIVTDEIRPLTEVNPLDRTPDRLAKLLDYSSEKIHYIYVEPSNPVDIRQKVSDLIARHSGSWGLHYTGGKKSMAAHAYLAVEQAFQQKMQKGMEADKVYSYLDADDLMMVVEKPDKGICLPIPVHRKLKVSLADLVYLHGQTEVVEKLKQLAQTKHETRTLGPKPNCVPFRPEIARLLLNAWQSAETIMAEWTRTQLRFESRDRLIDLYNSSEESRIAIKQHIRETLLLSYDPCPLPDASKSKVSKLQTELRAERWRDTRLPAAVESIGDCTIGALAAEWNESVGHVAEWLAGLWLEDYVLDVVRGIAQECQIKDYALGLESNIWKPENPKTEVFESDVLVMQGHRLFYISVTTDASKGLNKSKLFEAYVRAQQLGGDQAEVALVTFYKDSERLMREIKAVHGQRARVRVFGFSRLPNLPAEFKRWFDS